MSKQLIFAAIIILAGTTSALAHEPIARRLIREYHQQNARIQAEAERQRQQFAQWQKDWQRQAQRRQAALQKASDVR